MHLQTLKFAAIQKAERTDSALHLLACRNLLRPAASLALLLFASLALSAQPASPHLAAAPLTTTHAVHSLTPEQSATGIPIHLTAVATYFDPYIDVRHAALFVHDSTGSLFVRVPLQNYPPIHTGDLLQIDGISGHGDYAPIIQNPRIRILGPASMPSSAPRVTVPETREPLWDGQWVELEGLIQGFLITGKDVTFDLSTNGGPLRCIAVVEPGTRYQDLVDSLVRIRGNIAPVFNRNRQLVGSRLLFAGVTQIAVLSPGEPNPFDAQVVPISKILQYVPGQTLQRRVHIRGRVTLQWPGRVLCIQDRSEGICVDTTETTPLPLGTLVDVLGFPATQDFHPTLDNAITRSAPDPPQPVAPVALQISDIAGAAHDNQIVTVTGEIVGVDRSTGDLNLAVSTGNMVLTGILPIEAASKQKTAWQIGDTVRLTGVCNLLVDGDLTNIAEGGIRASNVHILLRSPDDVAILATQGWWTPGHLAAILGILLLTAVAAIAWVVVLRRQVAKQTLELRRNEDRLRHLSQHDVLTGLPNRLLLDDRMTMALAQAARSQSVLGLLMLDLDGFKNINDDLGHLAGDLVLKQVAERLRNSVRTSDTVARVGGDEFIVLLPNLHSAEDAEVIAGNIAAAISVPMELSGKEVRVAASVGVTTYPIAGRTAGTLMHHVDLAMYQAKSRGQGSYAVYSPNPSESPLA